jgi:hypothetical protein
MLTQHRLHEVRDTFTRRNGTDSFARQMTVFIGDSNKFAHLYFKLIFCIFECFIAMSNTKAFVMRRKNVFCHAFSVEDTESNEWDPNFVFD